LLVDEDTCATNFMIRDSKMMQLVAAEKEPITPFVRLVRSLYEQCNISCIMVIGGLGDYFHVADKVLVMDSYQCVDATERAKEIVATAAAAACKNDDPTCQQDVTFQTIRNRRAVLNKLDPAGKVKTVRKGIISYGETEIDLTSVEQIVSASQTSAIASCLQNVATTGATNSNGSTSLLCLQDQLQALDRALDQQGLDVLAPGQYNGGLTRPRLLEVGAAVNRIRRDGAVVQYNKK
jgi:predicted ABC-class ATPase